MGYKRKLILLWTFAVVAIVLLTGSLVVVSKNSSKHISELESTTEDYTVEETYSEVESTTEKITVPETTVVPETTTKKVTATKPVTTKAQTESPKSGKTFSLTAYCPCSYCSGSWGSNTATGNKAVSGWTVAVDPNIIPLGSTVVINGKKYIAHDTGGFHGNIIDIYFDTHEEAVAFGKQTATNVYWY